MIIAIDGPAASGKGTLGRRLAAHYKLAHLDTGLLYRAVAAYLLQQDQPLDNEEDAAQAASAIDVEKLDSDHLRGRYLGEAASIVSAYPAVRAALLTLQQRFAARPEGAVLDGRDIGTVICPHAQIKLFVTASPEERAARRTRELTARGELSDFEVILADIHRRDARDMTRDIAPLRPAPDAVVLDTTAMDAEAAFTAALRLVDALLQDA